MISSSCWKSIDSGEIELEFGCLLVSVDSCEVSSLEVIVKYVDLSIAFILAMRKFSASLGK